MIILAIIAVVVLVVVLNYVGSPYLMTILIVILSKRWVCYLKHQSNLLYQLVMVLVTLPSLLMLLIMLPSRHVLFTVPFLVFLLPTYRLFYVSFANASVSWYKINSNKKDTHNKLGVN